MFEGWQRSDVISTIALAVALAAAWYSRIQAKVAQRKELADIAAKHPVVEPTVKLTEWPGVYEMSLKIKNVENVKIRCFELGVTKPHDIRLAPFDAVFTKDPSHWGQYLPLEGPPPAGRFARTIPLDVEIPAEGTRREGPAGFGAMESDFRHAEVLVSRISRTSLSDWVRLEMSLKVERINERDVCREIMVVTKLPPITTKTIT